MRYVFIACLLVGCGPTPRGGGDDTGGDDTVPGDDASVGSDGNSGTTDGASGDSGANGTQDANGGSDAPVGIITGGPCLSGAPGKTAHRIRWIKAGSSVQVQYEVNGLPDKSRDKAGAYGYQIGFTPS